MRLTQFTAADRVRAFGYVIIAGIYFYIAQSISVHAANGLASGVWAPLVERSILLFLLVVGFAAMGRVFNRQRQPIRDMGLVFRPGWQREFGLGAALGWGMLLASILPLVLERRIDHHLLDHSPAVRDSPHRSAGARRGRVGGGSRFPRISLPAPDRCHGPDHGDHRFLHCLSPACTCSILAPAAPALSSRSSAAGCCRWRICAPGRFGSAGVGTLPGMQACVFSSDCR